MSRVLATMLGIILLGDYLMLSVSYVALGAKSNWLLLVGAAQVATLGLAVALGRARDLRVNLPMLGFVGLGCVMLLHAANRSISSGEITEYGLLKIYTYFAVSGPALLLGSIVGHWRAFPASRYYSLLSAPLLLMCGIAVATGADVMTIRTTEELAVFFGVLVLPVHQALAFSLGKISLWLHTASQREHTTTVRLVMLLGLVGVCLGLSVLSGSRGYLVAVIVALGAQWCVGKKRMGLMILTIGLPISIFIALSTETIRDGFDPEVLLASTSMQDRADLFSSAVDAFFASPFLGHGPGGFAEFYGWEERVYPHNLALEILSEFGIAGAVCFLLILGPAVLGIFRVMRTPHHSTTEVQFFAIGFFVFSVVGSLGVADLIRNYFFFFAAGMAAVSCSSREVLAPERDSLAAPATAT